MRIDKAPEGGKFRAVAATALDGQAGTWGDLDMLCVNFNTAGELIASEVSTGVGVIWTKEGRKPLSDGSENEVIGGRKYTVFTYAELVEAEVGTTPTLSAGDNLYASATGIVDITPAVGDVYIGTVLDNGSQIIINVNGMKVVTVAGVAAQGTLTIEEAITTTDQFTIGDIQYTMLTAPIAAFDIALGADEAASKVNIVAAINASGTEGVEYFAGTTINPLVRATTFAGDDCVLTARANGTAGNSIVSDETGNELTDVANVFDATTLGTTTAGVDQVPAV
jgi:hypothetical protein